MPIQPRRLSRQARTISSVPAPRPESVKADPTTSAARRNSAGHAPQHHKDPLEDRPHVRSFPADTRFHTVTPAGASTTVGFRELLVELLPSQGPPAPAPHHTHTLVAA